MDQVPVGSGRRIEGGVRREHHARVKSQTASNLRWFGVGHVQGGAAETAAVERIEQRNLVHEPTAADVDEHRATRDQLERSRIDQTIARRREWRVQRDNIACGEKLIEIEG